MDKSVLNRFALKRDFASATAKNLIVIWTIFFLAIMPIFPNQARAQRQANIWHFGDGRCLDFSSGVPVNVPGSQMATFEGCVSYCDPLGNFLFYTNGGGREPAFSGQDGGHIWNRNNGVMYDMQGVEGGGFSSRQSAVAFEAPGQSDVYYVFTMDEIEYTVGASPATNAAQPLGRGLRYFTVDMNQNGGLGSVVLADQPVYAPSAEGLCAIRHANKIDYWILINQDSTGIGVYSVTSSGVNFITNYTATGGGPGIIKASPDGSKVRTGEYLLDFNSSNGQLSNPLNLSASEFFEFSPNGRFLYDLQSPSIGPIVVSRYDLQAASIPSSISTIGIINAGLGSTGGQMQLGPDGKIYFLEVNFPTNTVKMHRINCPNTQAASVQLNVFTYTGYFVGLPNYPAWLFENYDSASVQLGPDTLELCGSTQSYLLNAQNPSATYLWSTGATTQTITVNTPGTYTVTVTGPCGTGQDDITIVNCLAAPPLLNCDTTGNWFLFSNYDGGKLNVIVDENIPNLKIGICTYEPVEVTFSGPFVGNITDVYYAGFNSSVGNNHCGFPILASSVNGVNPALVTIDVVPPVNIISPPNPNNILNQPNGFNFGVICVASCDTSTWQGGCNTIDQVLDVFQTRFGGSLRGLKVQYCCWIDSLPYRLSSVSGSCCSNSSGVASISYASGPFCTSIGGTLTPTLIGDSSGTFYSNLPGLNINPATGVIDLNSSSPGTYEVIYSIFTNCIPYLYRDTIVLSSCYSSPPIIASACTSYTAPWGTVYTQSGIYTDTLTAINGCDSVLTVNLTITGISNGPTIVASACSTYTAPWGTIYNQSGLYSDTLTSVNGCDSLIFLNLTIIGTINGANIITSACSSYTAPWGAVYTQSGLYTDTLTSVSGCDSIVSLNLTITGVITGASITASACSTYTAPWGLTYTQSGSYTTVLSSINGCDSTVSLNLTIIGTTSGPVVAVDTCDFYTAPWGITYSQSGIYSDTLTATNGCDSIAYVDLTIFPSPIVQINPIGSTTIVSGSSVQLSATGGVNYLWSPATGLSCINCASPIASPSQTTTYSVIGTDNNGCEATASITLDVLCKSLFVPNIFSPNKTGPTVNEQLCVLGDCINSINFAIYDRWGQIIFSTEDRTQCWDGTKDGKEVPAGIYAYRLAVRLFNNEEVITNGSIKLIR